MGVALTNNQGANMITIRQRYATAQQVYDIGQELANRVEALEQVIQEQQQQINELRLLQQQPETHRERALAAMTFDDYVKNQRVA
jgi:arginine utilization protein RocB